jgi:hypothetical protein
LCFTQASPEEVESCRVEIDPDGVEAAVVAEWELTGETIIAFAIR